MASVQEEMDTIYSLLAYALVYQDWQPEHTRREKRRGYNIGALLVDPENQPVQAGLNCINIANNATQHGELRAMMDYIGQTNCFNLEGFTIYTTLEPCIMCAGMMIMTAVKKVVFGQHDVMFSKAFERLSLDTSEAGGFAPYPRQVKAQASTTAYCKKLDDAYSDFLEVESEKMLARFLASDTAKTIYADAFRAFTNYQVRYPENKVYLEAARKFLKNFAYEPAFNSPSINTSFGTRKRAG